MKSHLHRVLLLLLLGCSLLVAVPSSAQDQPKSLAASLQPYVDNHTLAGAVLLVADKDKVLAVETVGYFDVRSKMAMPRDALFWIASQTKPITALALMMLVDEGKIKLDDPVEKYLPEFKGQWLMVKRDADQMLLKKPSHPITVREILSHTSGLPRQSAMEQPTLDHLSLRDAARSYAMTPLMFEPGTDFLYSNAGINLAGCLVEVVSGMRYEDFLDQRLFGPLGMKDTTFWPNEQQFKRLAKAYQPGPKKTGMEEVKVTIFKYPLSDRKRQPMAGGGLFSTADDVGRLCQMVLNGGVYKGKRYLSEAAVKEMTSRQTGPTIKSTYGLGWSTGGGTYGHGGAYSTSMSIDAKRGLITVFMVQHASGFPGNGQQSLATFKKAAEERFGGSK